MVASLPMFEATLKQPQQEVSSGSTASLLPTGGQTAQEVSSSPTMIPPKARHQWKIGPASNGVRRHEP